MYVFTLSIPSTVKLPLIATEEDTGPFTKALVEDQAGKNLIAYREWKTLDEYVEIIKEVSGVNTKTATLPAGVEWDAMPEELRQEMSDNSNYFLEFGYEGRDDPSLSHPKDVSVNHLDWNAWLTFIARCEGAASLGQRLGQKAGLECPLQLEGIVLRVIRNEGGPAMIKAARSCLLRFQ